MRLATVRGIPVRLHFTLLVVVGVLVSQLARAHGLAAGLGFGVLSGVLLFGSVLLHELGHSVVAQAFGLRISGIYLHVFGGMALMPELPRTPRQELLIALAGPLVSLALGLGLLALLAFGPLHAPEGLGALASFGVAPLAGRAPPSLATLAAWSMTINLGMFAFNLAPALPMDGGRVLRALLATRLGALRATRAAAWVSRVIAAAFVVLGVKAGVPSLPIIGLALLFMVAQELRAAELHDQLRRRAASPFTYGPGFRFAPSFRGWAPPRPSPPGPDADGPVIDVGSGAVRRETREAYVDRHGRRFVVVTRLLD